MVQPSCVASQLELYAPEPLRSAWLDAIAEKSETGEHPLDIADVVAPAVYRSVYKPFTKAEAEDLEHYSSAEDFIGSRALANELETLRAENAKLRSALEPFAAIKPSSPSQRP